MPTNKINHTLLFNDDHLVAVAKPYGLAVIPGRAETTSLLEELAEQLNLPCTGSVDPRLRVVHRLDKDTSGAMIFAKDLPTQRHLSNQFQNNTITKEYLALVVGRMESKEGEIDAPIGPHPTDRLRMSVLKHGGRPARTAWKIEVSFKQFTLLRVFPKTGKTHQIRVHLQHIGHPLAIDPLYHRKAPDQHRILLSEFKRDYRPTRGQEERALIERLTLHAHRLTFVAPDGHPRTIEAELPKDLRAVINQLSRHGR